MPDHGQAIVASASLPRRSHLAWIRTPDVCRPPERIAGQLSRVRARAKSVLVVATGLLLYWSVRRTSYDIRRRADWGRTMKCRLLGISAVFVLVMTTVTVVGEGVSGAAPLPSATGSVACKISGTGGFGPKLTVLGIPITPVKFHFFGASPTSGGCGGSAGIPNSAGSLTPVAINSVAVKGTGFLSGPPNANSCAVFSALDAVGTVKVKFTWGAVPAIAPTWITYTAGGPVVSGSPTDTITLPSGATMTATGSFSTPGTGTVALLTNIVSACSATWGPYSSFMFNPGSTVVLP